jgi:adenylate kinase family enzyme
MLLHELFTAVDEGVYDPHKFKAVFMAGAPGSGKSTIARIIFNGSGLKSLNVDTFWQLYKSMEKEGDYDRYWELYSHREKNYLDGRLGLLIDGTARNPEKMAMIKTRLESLGYETAMIFVNTTLETSLARADNRANIPNNKDHGRKVDAEFITNAWEQVQQGLGKLQSTFGHNFYIVDNNTTPQVSFVSKSMHRWLDAKVNNHIARQWIQDQLQLKNKTVIAPGAQ